MIARIGDIEKMGFSWPANALIQRYCVIQDDWVDLGKTLQALRTERAYHRQQIADAYAFKRQTGADYADFTDRFDDHVRTKHELGQAITYLERIVETLAKL